MQAIHTTDLELMRFTQERAGDNAVDAAWPVYRDTGTASIASVYVELPPGTHLPRHTDSAEELLVVLAGEIEISAGCESERVTAGGLAVVPAQVPHGATNVGNETARFVGVFPANTVVSVFEEPFEQTGGRVVGTPPPAEAVTADA